MNWTLYVRADCHDCDRVRSWMEEHGIPYEVRDIDQTPDQGMQRLFIAPALCKGAELEAYGVDIIAYLEGVPR